MDAQSSIALLEADTRLSEEHQLGSILQIYTLRRGLILLMELEAIFILFIAGLSILIGLFLYSHRSLIDNNSSLIVAALASVLATLRGLRILLLDVPGMKRQRIVVCEQGMLQVRGERKRPKIDVVYWRNVRAIKRFFYSYTILCSTGRSLTFDLWYQHFRELLALVEDRSGLQWPEKRAIAQREPGMDGTRDVPVIGREKERRRSDGSRRLVFPLLAPAGERHFLIVVRCMVGLTLVYDTLVGAVGLVLLWQRHGLEWLVGPWWWAAAAAVVLTALCLETRAGYRRQERKWSRQKELILDEEGVILGIRLTWGEIARLVCGHFLDKRGNQILWLGFLARQEEAVMEWWWQEVGMPAWGRRLERWMYRYLRERGQIIPYLTVAQERLEMPLPELLRLIEEQFGEELEQYAVQVDPGWGVS